MKGTRFTTSKFSYLSYQLVYKHQTLGISIGEIHSLTSSCEDFFLDNRSIFQDRVRDNFKECRSSCCRKSPVFWNLHKNKPLYWSIKGLHTIIHSKTEMVKPKYIYYVVNGFINNLQKGNQTRGVKTKPKVKIQKVVSIQ